MAINMELINFKKCAKCSENKELSEFGKDVNTKYGLRSRCKLCRSEDSKQYNKLNSSKVQNSSKKWYVNT